MRSMVEGLDVWERVPCPSTTHFVAGPLPVPGRIF